MATASVIAKCADNECILAFLRERQRELCGEWDGALTRAFRLAIISVAEQTQPLRSLHEASKIKNIGPSMQRQLRPFFASRPPVHGRAERPLDGPSRGASAAAAVRGNPGTSSLGGAGEGSEPFDLAAGASAGGHPGGSGSNVRKFVGYIPKKGSAAYAIIVTMFLSKLRGRNGMLKEELMMASEKCGLTDTQMRPIKPVSQGKRPSLDRNAVRTFYCGWSSMETLKKNNLVLVSGRPAVYSLTPEGHAVAQECVKRGRVPLPSPEDLQKEAAAAAALAAAAPVNDSGANRSLQPGYLQPQGGPLAVQTEPLRLGLAAIDPSAGPTTIVERSSFDTLRLPPLRPGEKFLQAYDIILLIDNREGGASQGQNTSTDIAENLQSRHRVLAEVRGLPVGDALWIARHKATTEDFVLDFILERKRADDLWASIKSKRYKDQKLRLQRCGLRKLLYVVEGDINQQVEAIRTAALQTEIEDGFDVQHTLNLNDTLTRYSDLTRAITLRYSEAWDAFAVASATGANADLFGGQERCMTYAEFLHVCRHINADSAGDLLGHMLLQIRNVTVDIAMAIMQRYPTLRLLAEAYRAMEGNVEAQARMLTSIVVKNKPISEAISRKICEFVWT